MNDEIEKSEQPNPDEVLAAIQSFNDPGIITNMFKELGWSYSVEIRETLVMAKQNANMSIKMKAIKHLRELLREASEAAGYVANVSQTVKNPQGGVTTFSAKRIAGILNPTKQIESTIKESKNDQNEKIKIQCNRGRNRGESKIEGGFNGKSKDQEGFRATSENEGSTDGADTLERFPPERDSGRADSERDAGLGGTEPPDGGETPGRTRGINDCTSPTDDSDSQESNPCISTRPPTGDRDLFPGISSAGD